MITVEMLETLGIGYNQKGSEFIIDCAYCGKQKHLYLNESGAWKCHHCGEAGAWATLRKEYGEAIQAPEERTSVKPLTEQHIEECFKRLLGQNGQDVCAYLQDRKIGRDLVHRFMLGLEKKEGVPCLAIPIYRGKKPVNIKYRTIPPAEKQFYRWPGGESALFNGDILADLKETDPVIITEGELDCISLCGYGLNVVGVTGGAQTFAPSWIRQLEKFKRIFLCYDSDDKGQRGAADVAKRLDLQRCYNVILPCKDANQWLQDGRSKEEFDALLAKAERFPIENVVTSRVAFAELVRDYDRQKTGTALGPHWPNVRALTGDFMPGDLVVVSAKEKTGKCLGKGTPVLMFDGTIKSVEEIVPGELLMGDDSKPRLVKALGRGVGNLYRIKQKKRNDYIVNEDHILVLQRTRMNKQGYICPRRIDRGPEIRNDPLAGEIRDWALKDYLCNNKTEKLKWRGMACAVEFPNREIFIDPYFLGLWLGDGTTANQSITNIEPEIKTWLFEYALSMGLMLSVRKYKDRAPTLSIISKAGSEGNRDNNLMGRMKEYGLFGNKHIPEPFMINDSRNRLQLLAGIIDTDGWVDSHSIAITLKVKRLAEEVQFVARSLGFRATMREVKKTIKARNFVGEYWKITISGDLSKIPLRVLRKRSAIRSTYRRNPLVTGIEIEAIGVGEYFGFELNGNGRFLLGDFTITHNTTWALNLAYEWVKGGHSVLFYCLEMRPGRLYRHMMQIHSRKTNEELNPLKMMEIHGEIGVYPIYWAYNFKKTTYELVFETMRLAVKRYGIEAIVFDNLHYMARDIAHQTQEVGFLSRSFKLLAEELEVPILLVAQPRKIEREAIMGIEDLKDSSSIGADADQVIILWREKTKAREGQQSSFKPQTLVRVDASRFLPGGETLLYFDGPKKIFGEVENR